MTLAAASPRPSERSPTQIECARTLLDAAAPWAHAVATSFQDVPAPDIIAPRLATPGRTLGSPVPRPIRARAVVVRLRSELDRALSDIERTVAELVCSCSDVDPGGTGP